jgi:hypothetical protein
MKGHKNMAKILVVAQCKDQTKWEAAFCTHADLFKTAYGLSKPISYGMGDGDHVGACFETNDLAKTLSAISSPATATAMEYDGVLRDTVKVLIFDKELAV